MKGSRPEQAVLSRDTDMSKTDETRRVIEEMVDGLNDHRIADIGEFFSEGFRWLGNTGCGTKTGLKEFQDNWQKPFQAAFSDKVCVDEARLYMGEWGGCVRATGSKRIPANSWDLLRPESGLRSATWISGRSLMARSSTTGSWSIFRMFWHNSARMFLTGRAGRLLTAASAIRRRADKGCLIGFYVVIRAALFAA